MKEDDLLQQNAVTRRRFLKKSGTASLATAMLFSAVQNTLAASSGSGPVALTVGLDKYSSPNKTLKKTQVVTPSEDPAGATHVFVPEGGNVLELTGFTANTPAGKITLEFKANGASGSGPPSKIIVTFANGKKQTFTVRVIVPVEIGFQVSPVTTGPIVAASIPGLSVAPADWPWVPHTPHVRPDAALANPDFHLATLFRTPVDIPILDQYGNALDACYAGTIVQEEIGASPPLAAMVMGIGKYVDWVGVSQNGAPRTLPADLARAKAWLKAFPIAGGPTDIAGPPVTSGPTQINVYVAGWDCNWFERTTVIDAAPGWGNATITVIDEQS